MSSSKHNYNKLKDKWYKKLKDNGFEDIEYKDGSIKSCIPSTSNKTSIDPLMRQVTEEYYYLAYHFLNEYKFETELEKVIWEYHTNGISVRDISKILTKAKMKAMGRDRVWLIVKKLKDKMKFLYLSV